MIRMRNVIPGMENSEFNPTKCLLRNRTMAEEDVNIDSDDEPDFDKMDMGSKKGPVGRWDFDTAEEYSDYMGQKEAMPKAAFQYGVKMNDGRKTRRGVGPERRKTKIRT